MSFWWRILFAGCLVLGTLVTHLCFRAERARLTKVAAAPPRQGHDAAAESVLKERIERYWDTSRSLNKNIYLWTTLVGLTFLILLRDAGQAHFTLLGQPVSASASQLLVVFLLFYLWVEFGALLKRAIDERMLLWQMLDSVECLPPEAHRPWTRKRLLEVNGVLDVWFLSFLPAYCVKPAFDPFRQARDGKVRRDASTPGVWPWVTWVVGAGMCGLAQASAFALLCDFIAAHQKRPLLAVLGWVLALLSVCMMLACYRFFQTAGHGKRFFLVCSCCAALGMVLMPALRDLKKAQGFEDAAQAVTGRF